jgi:hypothetical protein
LGVGKTTLYRKLVEYGETPKHPLYQEMEQAAKTERNANEAQNQNQQSQTSNLNP